MTDFVSMKVTQKVKDRIDKLKVHRREPYYEVLTRLLDALEILGYEHKK